MPIFESLAKLSGLDPEIIRSYRIDLHDPIIKERFFERFFFIFVYPNMVEFLSHPYATPLEMSIDSFKVFRDVLNNNPAPRKTFKEKIGETKNSVRYAKVERVREECENKVNYYYVLEFYSFRKGFLQKLFGGREIEFCKYIGDNSSYERLVKEIRGCEIDK